MLVLRSLLIVTVVFTVSVNSSPFKVEKEFDSNFQSNNDGYSSDDDSSRWGRRSMSGRRYHGRDLEKSRDNDFKEVSAGDEDEASEELAQRNNDFEKDDPGRMKGRGTDEDEEDERPFMKEDDGVPSRYNKIKKDAQVEEAKKGKPTSSSSPSTQTESPEPEENEEYSEEKQDEEYNDELKEPRAGEVTDEKSETNEEQDDRDTESSAQPEESYSEPEDK